MSVLLGLFLQFSAFSLIAFGGVNALLPVLYDISVNQEHWIDAQTFANYFAIAQAAPGPNFMTVTLIGWHVYGVFGALVATLAIAWPSSILIFWLQRYIQSMKNVQHQQAIQYAAAALAIGLVLASAWQISWQINHGVVAYVITLGTLAIMLLTPWHPLWLILLGALCGLFGII
ncbi:MULTISPECIES: chromate transporter [unclassified Polynucleobacter]|uniref:chromate transporter n=1 Tax=unclassified Polynucleobacter TaxID=2640945 RepID=UPI001F3D66C3|nr:MULTISPECIES: chromate transporter [unclassified Polynucleobacter]MCE7527602.1 chromate transporter [Polynucleobacter sp. IMCC 30228]MCE7529420.1 chromate transporter [Polynucleobacter sp. IMCC 29146]